MANIITSVNIEEVDKLGLRAGDSVRVWQKIEEGKDKEGKQKVRLQAFEGLILARKHGNEAGGTFTVRKTIDGIGVERIFPLYSPLIDSVEILKRSKVRRAKLYYIRDKASKEIKRQMRNIRMAKESVEEVVVKEEKKEASE